MKIIARIAFALIAFFFLSPITASAATAEVKAPDFAFPREVSNQALADLNKAIRNSDSRQVLRSLIDFTIAQSSIDADSLPAVLSRINQVAEAQKQPATRALLRLLQARIYLDKYTDSKYIYDSRQLPLSPLPAEFTEWSGDQFRDVISRLCTAAMADCPALESIPLRDYASIITPDDPITYTYYPTLADFVASSTISIRSRLSYFSNCFSTLLLLPAKAFILDSRYLPTQQEGAAILDAYAYLLKLHADDTAPLLLADINRIDFIYNGIYTTQHTDADSQRTRLLLDLYRQYASSEYSGAILLALESRDESLCPEADYYAMLRESVSRFPAFDRIGCLKAKIAEIERQNIDINFPTAAAPGRPLSVRVESSNASKVIVEVWRITGKVQPIENVYRPKQPLTDPILTFEVDFDGSIPFRASKEISVTLPDYGLYSITARLSGANQELSANYLPVLRCTNLAMSGYSTSDDGNALFVVNPADGRPVEGASVVNYSTSSNATPTVGRSDAEGMLTPSLDSYARLVASKGSDTYCVPIFFSSEERATSQFNREQLMGNAFADLPLYHPGDTTRWVNVVYIVKGLERRPAANLEVRAILYNANSLPVDTITGSTDEFGRLEGAFAIPQGELTGNYRIRFQRASDSKFIVNLPLTVSDYKMPTFYVEINPVATGVPALGDATITGRVATYSGMPMPGVPLSIRLSSGAFSFFASNSIDFYNTADTTAADGSFRLVVPARVFAAAPMPNGLFTADITATSGSGESRQASKSFSLSSPLIIDLKMSSDRSIDISKPICFDLKVTDRQGKAVDRQVALKVMKADSLMMRTEFASSNPTVDFSSLPSGRYKLSFSLSADSLAKPVDLTYMVLFRPSDKQSPVDDLLWISQTAVTIEGPNPARLFYGVRQGAPTYLLYILSADGRILERKWIEASPGLHELAVKLPAEVKKASLSLSTMRDYSQAAATIFITRTEASDQLAIHAESFRDKLIPGSRETWTLRTADGADRSVASAMILGMYNQALDAVVGSSTVPSLQFAELYSQNFHLQNSWLSSATSSASSAIGQYPCTPLTAPAFNTYGLPLIQGRIVRNMRLMTTAAGIAGKSNGVDYAAPMMKESMAADKVVATAEDAGAVEEVMLEDEAKAAEATPEFSYRQSNVPLAFFRPMLRSDADGSLAFSFDVPNANATWQFYAMAFTDRLLSANFNAAVIANKPVMMQPNLPRFLRSADRAVLLASVFNNADSALSVATNIEIFDPSTMKVVQTADTVMRLEPSQSAVASITIIAPADAPFVGYRIKSSSANFADGEQSLLPVLPASQPVIESQPFYLAPDSSDLSLQIASGGADTRTTLQYCANPAWYLITALPGLAADEARSACEAASCIFSAAVARGLLRDHPAIKQAIEQWTAGDASDSTLVSMLERNQDLRTLLLQATPWMLDARSDTERMQRMALLLDSRRIDNVITSSIATLEKLRRSDGGWAWVDMCRESSAWVTWQTLFTLGRLNSLGYLPDSAKLKSMIDGALAWYSAGVEKSYKENKNISTFSYLQLRDLWPDAKLSLTGQTIVNAAIQKIVKGWKSYDMPTKAIAAQLLYRHGYPSLSRQVVASLMEFAVSSPEKGMWWPSLGDMGLGGTMAQLQFTADALRAIALVTPSDTQSIDAIRQWLILQKEARNWGSSPTTTDIIAAFLSTSSSWMSPADNSVNISVDGKRVSVPDSDRLLGYFRADLSSFDPSGKMLSISRANAASPAWGAVYTQSVQPMTDIAAASTDAVSIEKRLYRLTTNGWEEANTLEVGDRIKIQLLIHASRDMQYMAITDNRAACFEPVEQIPAPIYSEGICFYRENLDAATNMFVTNMPKGTFLLEYELWCNNAGSYASGIATIQSQYAPQLTAHSAGTTLTIIPGH